MCRKNFGIISVSYTHLDVYKRQAKRRLIAATIQFFDLFSGIGGFREGLRRAGNFVCVGHCEVCLLYTSLGYPVSIEGAAKYWREDILVQRRISPEITTSTVIAWRRHIPYSLAVRKMIEEINAFQA